MRQELDLIDPLARGLAETEHSFNEQFRLGAITYLVFLDGVSRLDDVRLRHIQLQLLYLRTRVELARLTGDPVFFPLPTKAQALTTPAQADSTEEQP